MPDFDDNKDNKHVNPNHNYEPSAQSNQKSENQNTPSSVNKTNLRSRWKPAQKIASEKPQGKAVSPEVVPTHNASVSQPAEEKSEPSIPSSSEKEEKPSFERRDHKRDDRRNNRPHPRRENRHEDEESSDERPSTYKREFNRNFRDTQPIGLFAKIKAIILGIFGIKNKPAKREYTRHRDGDRRHHSQRRDGDRRRNTAPRRQFDHSNEGDNVQGSRKDDPHLHSPRKFHQAPPRERGGRVPHERGNTRRAHESE